MYLNIKRPAFTELSIVIETTLEAEYMKSILETYAKVTPHSWVEYANTNKESRIFAQNLLDNLTTILHVNY